MNPTLDPNPQPNQWNLRLSTETVATTMEIRPALTLSFDSAGQLVAIEGTGLIQLNPPQPVQSDWVVGDTVLVVCRDNSYDLSSKVYPKGGIVAAICPPKIGVRHVVGQPVCYYDSSLCFAFLRDAEIKADQLNKEPN